MNLQRNCSVHFSFHESSVQFALNCIVVQPHKPRFEPLQIYSFSAQITLDQILDRPSELNLSDWFNESHPLHEPQRREDSPSLKPVSKPRKSTVFDQSSNTTAASSLLALAGLQQAKKQPVLNRNSGRRSSTEDAGSRKTSGQSASSALDAAARKHSDPSKFGKSQFKSTSSSARSPIDMISKQRPSNNTFNTPKKDAQQRKLGGIGTPKASGLGTPLSCTPSKDIFARVSKTPQSEIRRENASKPSKPSQFAAVASPFRPSVRPNKLSNESSKRTSSFGSRLNPGSKTTPEGDHIRKGTIPNKKSAEASRQRISPSQQFAVSVGGKPRLSDDPALRQSSIAAATTSTSSTRTSGERLAGSIATGHASKHSTDRGQGNANPLTKPSLSATKSPASQSVDETKRIATSAATTATTVAPPVTVTTTATTTAKSMFLFGPQRATTASLANLDDDLPSSDVRTNNSSGHATDRNVRRCDVCGLITMAIVYDCSL